MIPEVLSINPERFYGGTFMSKPAKGKTLHTGKLQQLVRQIMSDSTCVERQFGLFFLRTNSTTQLKFIPDTQLLDELSKLFSVLKFHLVLTVRGGLGFWLLCP